MDTEMKQVILHHFKDKHPDLMTKKSVKKKKKKNMLRKINFTVFN